MSSTDGREILVASYVKWLEASGARVIPLRYTAEPSELVSLLGQVNGVLFPGGNAPMVNSSYGEAVAFVFSHVMASNEQGQYLPFWGTCLGFEEMMLYSSNGSSFSDVLSAVDAEDIFVPVRWLPESSSSWLLKGASAQVLQTLSTKNVSINMHEWGVLWSRWQAGLLPSLSSQYRVLATSLDREGLEFVALAEHVQFPVAGFQAHAEKNAFEWSQGHPDYVHDPAAVQAMQFLGASFVSACRRCNQSFASEAALEPYLIYEFAPTFTGVDEHVEQTYFFV